MSTTLPTQSPPERASRSSSEHRESSSLPQPPEKNELPHESNRPKQNRRSSKILWAGSLGILLLVCFSISLIANQLNPSSAPNNPAAEADSKAEPAVDSLQESPSLWTRLTALLGDWTGEKNSIPANLMTKTINQSRFRITVNEKGTLNSQKNVTLSCQVPGSTTIISIVPEGTQVKEGQIVCELDSSALEEKSRQQEIDVTNAEATLSAARENLEIQKNQNASDIAIAKLSLELARLDLQKYLEGELPQQRDTILGQMRLKEENLARKKESYDFTKRMAQKGYRSLSELEAERIAVTQAEIDLKVEADKLRVLENFTSKRDIAMLQSDAIELEREMERTERKAAAALTKAEAEYASKQLTLEVEKEKYREWLKQIEYCTMRAPQNGEVVYANQSSSSSRRGSTEPDIYEGATVRERQAIIIIPDNTLMKIDAKIHESMISKLKIGQPVFIRADAQPGEVFEGVLAEISSVPLSGSWPNYDVKEYQIAIYLTDTPEKVSTLKTGLTAEFEIIVDDRENVLQSPMQAIVQVGRQYYCWVVEAKKVTRHQIKIGSSNDTDIEILDGLSAGMNVVMNPRSRFTDEINQLEEAFAVVTAAEPAQPTSRPLPDSAKSNGKPDEAAEQGGQRRPGGGRPGGDNRQSEKPSDQRNAGKRPPESKSSGGPNQKTPAS